MLSCDFKVSKGINEAFLLHGTKPDTARSPVKWGGVKQPMPLEIWPSWKWQLSIFSIGKSSTKRESSAGPFFFLQKVSALLHTSLHCCGRNWPKNKVWTSQVKKILSDGLNERFSGGLFGHGSYLAEEHGGVDG